MTSATERTVSGKPIALILGAVLIGAAIFKWWPSDERAVRRQLDALADTLTVPPTDTELARATRLAELRNYFAPDARIHVDDGQEMSPDDVMAIAERWTAPPGGLFVSFTDQRIQIAGDNAEISLTGRISRRDDQTGRPIVEQRDTALQMARREGEWLITKAEVKRALPLPPDR